MVEQFFSLFEHHAVLIALAIIFVIGVIKVILMELESMVILYKKLRDTIRGNGSG